MAKVTDACEQVRQLGPSKRRGREQQFLSIPFSMPRHAREHPLEFYASQHEAISIVLPAVHLAAHMHTSLHAQAFYTLYFSGLGDDSERMRARARKSLLA
eukprot:6178996-Pleurochrysis_carterae.AAC.2